MFTKRISNYFPVQWHIIPPQKNAGQLSEILLKKKEAEAVLALLQKDDYLIALDGRGMQMGSDDLAGFIQQRANESKKSLIFFIGGSYGIHEILLNRADHTWSLSKLVFPHQLVRLILVEQVYRSCTIIKNEKYHHS